jgi:hypothetical protein
MTLFSVWCLHRNFLSVRNDERSAEYSMTVAILITLSNIELEWSQQSPRNRLSAKFVSRCTSDLTKWFDKHHDFPHLNYWKLKISLPWRLTIWIRFVSTAFCSNVFLKFKRGRTANRSKDFTVRYLFSILVYHKHRLQTVEMGWTGFQVFLAILLVTTGSLNTLTTK